MNILSIKDLTKHYGKIHAVDHLTLDVEKGMVFGLLGPNGSGKTTTLGSVLDVIKPTTGSYSWFEKKPSGASRKKIGAILETPAFYPYLSAVKNLGIIAKIKEYGQHRIDEVIEQVGLADRKKDAFRTYSLGMKQRLSIAAALLSDPPVLILDEPTNGLDPQGIAEIRDLILTISGQGKTIIFASHILDEVQKVCSHFAVLRKGKRIFVGSVVEALSRNHQIEVAANDMALLENTINAFRLKEKINHDKDKLLIKLKDGASTQDLNEYLVKQGIVVNHLALQKTSLEQEFLKILADSND